MELLKKALKKEKKARKEAEHITAKKSIELSNSKQQLQKMDKLLAEAAANITELNQLIDATNAPIFSLDYNGIIHKWNKASEKITGFQKDEVVGKDLVLSYITKANQKEVKKLLNDALLGKETTNYHLTLFAKDGERKIISFNFSRRLDVDDKTTEIIAVGRDITKLTFQNAKKKKRTNELDLANKEIDFQSEEKEKRAEELVLANKELAFQNKEKEKRADELMLANKELTFQNNEKDKRANELIFANEEKEKRANELAIANIELDFQNEEKEKRAEELVLANKELAFQNNEKGKRADELAIANKELMFQNNEKDKRANELILANEEKEKKANELVIANIELDFQNKEKQKRAEELILANAELTFQNNEKDKRANELAIANIELDFQNEEKEKRANELLLAKKELAYQKELDGYRSEMERVALDLTQLIETANAPIFGIDNEGLVNEWNQTSEKITNFTKDEVLGKNLVQTYITEDYQEAVKKVLDNALLGKETANFEFPLFTKEKKRVMVLLNSSTRRNANGKITGVLGVGQDITELVGYRNELEFKVNQRTLKLNEALKKEKELSELKSKFVSTASHEFRTPLSAINFAAGSIKKYWTKMEPVIIEEKLHKIEDQVLHMTKLLDDVLLVGQAEANKMVYNPVHINIGEFIYEIIEEVGNSDNKLHEISLIDNERLKNSTIFIDEKLGRNIFINIISNAVKFSPNSDKVTIEFSSEKDFTVISVTDFGIGIPETELTNIFNPFTRAENVALIQGTGLGLCIVKEAIIVLGGKIIVNSIIGKGTTFIVKIPQFKHRLSS